MNDKDKFRMLQILDKFSIAQRNSIEDVAKILYFLDLSEDELNMCKPGLNVLLRKANELRNITGLKDARKIVKFKKVKKFICKRGIDDDIY